LPRLYYFGPRLERGSGNGHNYRDNRLLLLPQARTDQELCGNVQM
jgi:hypothetical protein